MKICLIFQDFKRMNKSQNQTIYKWDLGYVHTILDIFACRRWLRWLRVGWWTQTFYTRSCNWIIPNIAHEQSVDYLRVGRPMFCHAVLITLIPWVHIRVQHATPSHRVSWAHVMLPRTESVQNISSQKNTSQYPWRREEIRDVPGLKGLALLWLIGARLFDAGEICELKLHTATCLASHYVGKRHRTNNEPQNRIINVCVKKMKKSLSSNGSHGQPVVTCYWMRPRPADGYYHQANVWSASSWTGTNRSHTSNIMSEQLVERVCDLNSSLTPEYFLPSQWIPVLAVYSLPLRIKYLFTLHQRVAQKLSDMWGPCLEITAAQLPSVTVSSRNQISYVWTYVHTWASGSDDRGNPIPRIDVNWLIVDWLIDWLSEQKPYPVWFSWKRKSYPRHCEHSRKHLPVSSP